MKIKNDNQHQNNPIGGCPRQSAIWEFLTFDFKKMITEVLLVLPLYLILFFIWWRFRHLIKIMTDVGDISNDNEFFGDIIDTPKEGIEQHIKREELKSVTDKDKLGINRHMKGWTRRATKLLTKHTLNTGSVN